jgi:hypothetical protein
MSSGLSSGNWDVDPVDPEISTWPCYREAGDVAPGLYELSPANDNNATYNIVLYAKAIHFMDLDGSKQAETEFAKIINAFTKIVPAMFPDGRILLLWNVTLGFTTTKIMVYSLTAQSIDVEGTTGSCAYNLHRSGTRPCTPISVSELSRYRTPEIGFTNSSLEDLGDLSIKREQSFSYAPGNLNDGILSSVSFKILTNLRDTPSTILRSDGDHEVSPVN